MLLGIIFPLVRFGRRSLLRSFGRAAVAEIECRHPLTDFQIAARRGHGRRSPAVSDQNYTYW
jgi:hypothetical protein